ncbi:glutathione S-transferase family protein [Iodidimonas sp. SYSU 1G8]
MSLQLLIANKNYSSWSVRPWLVLTHFGIPFETTLAALFQDDHAPALIRSWSGAGKVPVLRDGDLTVWESLAIIEYLADRHPEHAIWPEDMAGRARARAVSAEMHAGFQNLRGEMPMNARRRYDSFSWSDACAADIARVQQLWTECLSRSGGPFLFGPFCAADAMFAPVISRLHTYGVALDPLPASYAAAVWEVPAVKQWLADAAAEPGMLARYEFD